MLVSPSASDVELLERAIHGDAEAFGALYRQHLERVYRYVLYRVSDPLEAEDLTETVFLKVWEALADYRATGLPWTAWLFRIAGNTVIDYYRTRRQHAELDETLPTRDRAPDEAILAGDEVDQLRVAIQQLAPEHQDVLLLRFVEGLSHADVARMTGKTEGAVRVIQHRALAALGALLEPDTKSGGRK
jgi:RNA polymerase sigma-70 factor, ECF subfamily